MTGRFGAKRDVLARCMYWSGGVLLSNYLPAKNSLLVLLYHRLGNPSEDPYDRGVFSATGEQFDDHIRYLKRNFSPITLEEAEDWITGPARCESRGCRVLVTFDDGYLDNYEIGFPILRSHGVQGVFFLSSSLVGSSAVPWWDEIAYLLRTARNKRFTLQYPVELAVNIAEERISEGIRKVINLYKTPENQDPERFMEGVRDAVQGDDLGPSVRRFLDWDEARAMVRGGMAIGSHCHSHRVLSKLDATQQGVELSHSRSVLQERVGMPINSVAYPVGIKDSFSTQTERLAREAGYKVAFSNHGGVNLSEDLLNPYDVRRVGVSTAQDKIRFRVQATSARLTGKFWP
ncbi:MAG TPA: polysaccharide deacetylase family protein [Terracidiphilus sp.]|jgi:peptidoglycan/xylan/chitin deacetylase (PgdA/CDA1 family)